ncbi:lipopolysaccharide-induced tumor necrosis factor-alpha factor homolog [Pempheris klunzingeri]|uniref:lipopolysaccharide-induced tumor necrosis factor-alpha factor homolog n=1 Tax=Pempheris klunzingeri TaxID=3127111 RepID=UPI0039805D86
MEKGQGLPLGMPPPPAYPGPPVNYNAGTYQPAAVNYNAGTSQPAAVNYNVGTSQPAAVNYNVGTSQPAVVNYNVGTSQPAVVNYNVGTCQPAVQPVQQPAHQYSQQQIQVVQTVSQTVVQCLPTEVPGQMKCPRCQNTVVTTIKHKTGLYTWMVCGIVGLFLLWPCCLLPFCIASCKDVEHSCPVCQNVLHIYRRM